MNKFIIAAVISLRVSWIRSKTVSDTILTSKEEIKNLD
jgi:hypothetical protein